MMFTREWLATATVAALVGCGGSSATEPDSLGNPVFQTVAGSGRAAVTMPLGGDPTAEPPNTTLDPFSVDATGYLDGTAEGKVAVRNVKFAPQADQEGNVTCMASLRTTGIVLIGADIPAPAGAPPPLEGHAYFFSMFVRDNGDGAGAPPDQILYGYQMLPDAFSLEQMCIRSVELHNDASIASIEALFADVEGGSIQVDQP